MEGEKANSTLAIENSQVLRQAANRQWDQFMSTVKRKGAKTAEWQTSFMSWSVLENWRRAMVYQSFAYYELEQAAWRKEQEEMERKVELS